MNTQARKLGDIAEVMAGVLGFGDNGDYPYQIIQPNSFTDTGKVTIIETQYRKDLVPERQLLRHGDIILKRLNPSFVHVVTEESAGMAVSTNLIVVRPSKEVDPFYLGYMLEQKDILGQVEHVTGNSAAIKAIPIKKLINITIPVTSLEEQSKIGKLWKLARYRKQLLIDYIAENDRLVSQLAINIINNGGNR